MASPLRVLIAAHVIKRERPETGILILSQHDDESYVWALLEGGVAGYAQRDASGSINRRQCVRRSRQAWAQGIGAQEITQQVALSTTASNGLAKGVAANAPALLMDRHLRVG